MAADLDRFVDAQFNGVYDRALAELQAGSKTGHWMWFIFPQLAGLGRSETARRYAIASIEEARAYAADPLLGHRLLACVDAMLQHSRMTAAEILGETDAIKLRSSMTLFERAAPGELRFGAVLERYYAGARDRLTLELLGAG